ncbi:MAG: ROK family protein [Bryobacteraceae bacterium]
MRSVLCVDIGGTSSKVGVLNSSGELSFVDSIPTRPDADSFLHQLCALIDRTRSSAQLHEHQITGLGIAVAGFFNPERDHIVYNSNLQWLEGFPLRNHIAARFDLPLELEVDSNAAAMAEYLFGSGRGSQRFLCVTSGTGLGVGMIIEGIPLRFAYGCLGDMGHLIVQRDGPLCTCGGRGCAEALVSAPSLAQRYKEGVSLRDVISAARIDDQKAIAVLAEAGEWLGIAISSMANTFFPDHIAVAGGLSEAGDFVMKPLERAFHRSASLFARSKTSLTRARLGSSATLIGAAWPFLR